MLLMVLFVAKDTVCGIKTTIEERVVRRMTILVGNKPNSIEIFLRREDKAYKYNIHFFTPLVGTSQPRVQPKSTRGSIFCRFHHTIHFQYLIDPAAPVTILPT